MSFNVQSLVEKFHPLSGLMALVIPFVLAAIAGLGNMLGFSSVNPDHTVVFKVVDQNGLPRHCSVRYDTTEPQTDDAKYTTPNGIFSLPAKPGEQISLSFDCDFKNAGTQIASVTVTAPEQGPQPHKVVIPNPNIPSLSSQG